MPPVAAALEVPYQAVVADLLPLAVPVAEVSTILTSVLVLSNKSGRMALMLPPSADEPATNNDASGAHVLTIFSAVVVSQASEVAAKLTDEVIARAAAAISFNFIFRP